MYVEKQILQMVWFVNNLNFEAGGGEDWEGGGDCKDFDQEFCSKVENPTFPLVPIIGTVHGKSVGRYVRLSFGCLPNATSRFACFESPV